MLFTLFSSRNLVRKQFSCELHIKKKHLCTYTPSFALLSVPLQESEKYFFFLVSLGFGGSLMFHSGSGLAKCLKHCT